ncbi:uncharacterized protein EDB91DRAFT_1185475 [Suillus paluster]|uniref:uncharacterized protein n=1 Tax=Suillus paluster TaxID=48578 RepID=UPI001B867C90|nr:uncharacterized protein EDB91DRAFT_1185475 [Suillus paluster]KAG1718420.1 hypothetical protein EDB91DRAFT_1185475 [Suillus paluster]
MEVGCPWLLIRPVYSCSLWFAGIRSASSLALLSHLVVLMGGCAERLKYITFVLHHPTGIRCYLVLVDYDFILDSDMNCQTRYEPDCEL